MSLTGDPRAVVASAPGKVLLAGGYLILERPHTGVVVGLDARFRSLVQLCRTSRGVAVRKLTIDVHSPQFHDHRRYEFRWEEESQLQAIPVGGKLPKPNRYVEVVLLYTLSLIRAISGDGFFEACVEATRSAGWSCDGAPGLEIVLAADNAFYSQTAELCARKWPMSVESLRKLPPMLPPRPDAQGEVAKTGLGSSATLVTSLTAALLSRFGVLQLPAEAPSSTPPPVDRAQLEMLHSLAQLAHCAAQGKVGSGFDVCAAVYGSHRYTRFSPAVLAEGLALDAGTAPADTLLRCVLCPSHINSSTSAKWDHKVVPFELPPGVELVMGDVNCGANTPSMVKKILAWRKADGDASSIWAQYSEASASLQDALSQLCDLYRQKSSTAGGYESWMEALSRCGSSASEEWKKHGDVGCLLSCIRQRALATRQLLREISQRAETPVEPPEQTELLDATMAERGVLLAVVPGAGGNDAVLALVLPSLQEAAPTAAARSRLEALWSSWAAGGSKRGVVCELPVKESSGVGDGHNGVLLEGTASVQALRVAATRSDTSQKIRQAVSAAILAASVGVCVLIYSRRR